MTTLAPPAWPDGVPKLEPIPAPNLPPTDRQDRRRVALILGAAVLLGGPAAFGLWATGLADAPTAVACGGAFLAPALAAVAWVLFRLPIQPSVTFTIPTDDGAR